MSFDVVIRGATVVSFGLQSQLDVGIADFEGGAQSLDALMEGTVDLVTGKSTVQNPRVVIFPRDSKNPDNGVAPDSP